jgi:hypothetical protein
MAVCRRRFCASLVDSLEVDELKMISCVGCGALLEEREGPTHRYMESSPACWAIYGEVLAREYASPDLMDIHRLTVDAYAVQHPGRESTSTINSVAIHLMRLCLLLEQGLDMRFANEAIKTLTKEKRSFCWLKPPSSLGAITVVDLWMVHSPEEHKKIVRDWAMSAWQAWGQHHETIREWLQASAIAQSQRLKK